MQEGMDKGQDARQQDPVELSLNDAIRVAQILAKAPEERLPLIMSVFNEAGLTVEGLEQLEEWKTAKEQVILIDTQEFIGELAGRFPEADGWIEVKNCDFTEFCNEKGLKARHVRKALANKGLLKMDESKKKTSYTLPLRRDGELGRYVLIKALRNGGTGIETDGAPDTAAEGRNQ